MKDVRIWFTKDNECRYISHLDLNRCMLRALHKSRIPIWHTEGFNVHPYATFPLPLSLGFRGERECMDVRLVEEFDFSELVSSMNACLPSGIRLFDVTEPVMKAKEITFADFKIRVTAGVIPPDELFGYIKELFELPEITVEKKTKKKGIKEIDIKPYIKRLKVERNIGGAVINITLPAGSVTNINPLLFQKAVEKYYGLDVYFDVTKQEMYNADMKPFR